MNSVQWSKDMWVAYFHYNKQEMPMEKLQSVSLTLTDKRLCRSSTYGSA